MTFHSLHRLQFHSRFAPQDLVPGAPGRSHLPRRFSTKAFHSWLSESARPALRRALRSAGQGLAGIVRASGVPQHWRFLVLLTLLSFATAWMGTRALMAGFENTWTEVALSAARHENQELRTRQEILREETEAAQFALDAAAAHPAAVDARYP